MRSTDGLGESLRRYGGGKPSAFDLGTLETSAAEVESAQIRAPQIDTREIGVAEVSLGVEACCCNKGSEPDVRVRVLPAISHIHAWPGSPR